MKQILITGATGFLGGAVVANLLHNKYKDQLLLLVRADSLMAGLSRVKDNLTKFSLDQSLLDSLTKENILLGDLSSPDDFINDPRIDKTTHVVNCAAIASFGKNPIIWKVNVEGTFRFAKRMSQIKVLERFLHVGTAMSCVPECNTIVTEDILDTEREEHIVEYTWSKARIEKMMLELLPSLPLVIARPSIIVGHSKYGCEPSSSIFWVFKMAIMLGKFTCNMNDRVDVISVDYCADALTMILFSKELSDNIFHISAGEKSSVTFSEIDQAMAISAETLPVGAKYKKITHKELQASRKEFKKTFGPCNERIMLRAINLYGSFAELNVIFDNKKILELGMYHPNKFTDYIHNCYISTKDKSIPELMGVDFK